MSMIVKGIGAVCEFTAMTRLGMGEIAGGSSTVTVKDRETMLLLKPPSLTVTVMIAVPDAAGAAAAGRPTGSRTSAEDHPGDHRDRRRELGRGQASTSSMRNAALMPG